MIFAFCPECGEANLESNAPCRTCGSELPGLSTGSEQAGEGAPGEASQPSWPKLVGQRISHYEVLELHGAGGMGVVYRARDTALGRIVALKLLSPRLSMNPTAKTRFLREAHAASALDDPNIATVHEIVEHDGQLFLAMTFYEGETLQQRLKRGPLPLSEAESILRQLASALASAHEGGIVHRDLKPANVMLTRGGRVKLLDFGLAKLMVDSERQDPSLTRSGQVLGTVAYMSPEQIHGTNVDHRTDLWSLGVVGYEMVTGAPPFKAESHLVIPSLILREEPQPPSALRRDIPAHVEDVILKLLRKDAAQRFQSAAVVLKALTVTTDLREVSQGVSNPGGAQDGSSAQVGPARTEPRRSRKGLRLAVAAVALACVAAGLLLYRQFETDKSIDSIAVLPFVNASGSPDAEYLSDGITETVIDSLSQLHGLKVIARSSTFRYKGQPLDPHKVRRELGVRAILTGTVAQRGEQLLISAELMDAQDERHIWGGRYDRRLSDVLAVQREISQGISEKLRLRLEGGERERLNKRYTESPEAYQLYLKARFFGNKRNEEALNRGIEYLQQAIDKDPGYALAYAGLSDSYFQLGTVFLSALPPKEALAKAKAMATKALELDATLSEAHSALGNASTYSWDWSDAERQFQQAIHFNSNSAGAHTTYAWYLGVTRRPDEAIAESNRALELGPLSLGINTQAGYLLLFARQYDQAIEQLLKTLDLEPNYVMARWLLGMAYLGRSSFDEAIAELEKAVHTSGRSSSTIAVLGHAYAVSGRVDLALRILGELEEMSKRQRVSPFSMALLYAGLGRRDVAFEWLEKSYLEGSYGMTVIKVLPMLDSLRPDPRFADLLRRVGLPP